MRYWLAYNNYFNEQQQKFMHNRNRHVGHRKNNLCESSYFDIQKFSETNLNTFCINLDPAVMVLPYDPIIDIREKYHYKKVFAY